MNILHVAETIKGGVSTIISELVNGLGKEKANENIYCLVPEDQFNELDCVFSGVFLFRRTGRDFLSIVHFSLSLIRAVIKTKPDIVHLHSSFAGFFGRLILYPLRLIYGFNVVYCSHGWAFLMDVQPWKRNVYIWIERILAYLCDVVICISDHEKNSAIDYGVAAKKIVVIKNGVSYREVAESMSLEDGEKLNLLF